MSKKYNRSSGFGNYGYLWWKSEERYLFFFGINRRSVCNCCCPRPVCFYFIYMYLNICMILILVWSVWLVINFLCITIRKVILYIYQNWYIFRPNIYLDIRESKQNHETDLQWMVDYISAEKTNAKKIIVYCRYTFYIYSYIHVYNDREEKPLDLTQRKCRRRPLFFL